jgi:hypothetical protein
MKTQSLCSTGEIKTRKKKLGCFSREVKKIEKNQAFTTTNEGLFIKLRISNSL